MIDLSKYASGGPWGLYWPGCCCGCVEYSDAFGRANSTNLGSRWSEKLGDWEIDSEHLVEAGTLSAKLLFLLPMPTAAMIVSVDTVDEAIGDEYKIFIGHDHPDQVEPNSYWATFEIVLDNGERKANLAVGYNDEILQTASLIPLTGTSRTFSACLAYGSIGARLTGTPCVDLDYWYLVARAEEPGGRYAGLGNAGESEITFDNWNIIDHYSHDKSCPDCSFTCCGFTLYNDDFPTNLTLSISAPDCPLLDGLDIPLTRIGGGRLRV